MSDTTFRYLTCMVGLPQSGKSTWAENYARHTAGTAILSADAVRLSMHGREFWGSLEPLVWQHLDLAVKSLLHAGNREVIVDACHLRRDHRSVWVDLESLFQFRILVRFVRVYAHHTVCRTRADNNTNLIDAIDRMYLQQQLPSDGDEEWPRFFDGTYEEGVAVARPYVRSREPLQA